MKSKDYRNSENFLRNSFETDGLWGFPIIKKQALDLTNISLISCSDVSKSDEKNLDRGVHFFVDDYRFINLYNHPEKSVERYGKYKFILTPDYSLYSEMNLWRQIESIGKARWMGAYWQSKGLIVVPTMSWAQPSSYRFCYDAVEKHSIVAVGMIGCKQERISFMRGYQKMLERIEPEAIICFGNPFPEMDGYIISVDYITSRKVV